MSELSERRRPHDPSAVEYAASHKIRTNYMKWWSKCDIMRPPRIRFFFFALCLPVSHTFHFHSHCLPCHSSYSGPTNIHFDFAVCMV